MCEEVVQTSLRIGASESIQLRWFECIGVTWSLNLIWKNAWNLRQFSHSELVNSIVPPRNLESCVVFSVSTVEYQLFWNCVPNLQDTWIWHIAYTQTDLLVQYVQDHLETKSEFEWKPNVKKFCYSRSSPAEETQYTLSHKFCLAVSDGLWTI